MMRTNQISIDFDGISAAALNCAQSLLPELVPGGRFEGHEYVALNPSRADKSLGSFKINCRTGKWSEFATADAGGDIIGWYAHAYDLDQGEAARRIAEKLGVPAYKNNGAGLNDHATESAPAIFPWGEEGPPVQYNELRRHYFPKNGDPKQKVKIKKRSVPKNKWANCYRVFRDGAPVGWQWEKPKGYRDKPYFGAARDPKRIFWPEGEKDADTLDRLSLSVFTFGGIGGGLPDGVEHYLRRLGDRELIITADNDAEGHKHAQKKAALAHAAGVTHIRIFDPKTVWPECPEGGDITDWFEKGGGTRERLIEIVDALPNWQPNNSDAGNDKSTKKEEEGPCWDYPDLSLLDDRRGELPPFPLDVFSTSWQEWATNAAHGAGTAVDHVVVPLFGIASSLIGIARRVRASRSWLEPFTMWTTIVGYSGSGKTPGLDVTLRALARIEHNRKPLIAKLRRAHESKIESAKAANSQWKEKVREAVDAGREALEMPADAEIPGPFVAPRLYVSDSTIEKLAVLFQARPQGMLVIRDELAGLFLNLSRYSGGTDKEFWLEAWNGKPYSVERVHRPPTDVQHLLVGITGGFQPDKLSRSFDGDADGLYARVLFSWPTEAPYRPLTDTVEEVEPEFENALNRLIDLAEIEEEKLILHDVRLTPDAVIVFEQFRRLVHQKKDGLDGREREWLVKTPAHVLRLAGTLAYLHWARETTGATMPEPDRIETCFVAAAIRLVREYFWPHTRAALRQLGLTEQNTKARKVLRWLRVERSPGHEVSSTDIRRGALGQSLDAKATTKLIEELVKAGWLRRSLSEKDGRGRPRNRWCINPLLWSIENSHSGREATDAQPEVRFSASSAFIASTQETDGDEAFIQESDGHEDYSDGEESTWTV
jgi:Protein of unknown function (DUF3987)